jgi:hypothetical protein
MSFNEELIGKEIERILHETLDGCNTLERLIIKKLMIQCVIMMNEYPARVQRLTYEALHRYYCLIEGLEKK